MRRPHVTRARGFVWWLVKTFSGFILSTKGFVLVAGLAAWISSLNVSNSLLQPIESIVMNVAGLVASPATLFFASIIIIALAYRFPKTVIAITGAVLATIYLTPMGQSQEIVGDLWFLPPVGAAVFILSFVFLALKARTSARRYRHRLTAVPR